MQVASQRSSGNILLGNAGAGSGVPHQFSYPDKAAENMAVLQFANADAGAEGIAQLVLEAASAAVKVRLNAVAEALRPGTLSQVLWH